VSATAASAVPTPARDRPTRRTAWPAVLGPLRWLATAAGMAAGVVRQGLRPVSWRRPARAEFLRFMDLAGVQNLPAVVVAGVLVGISLVAQGMYWLDQLGEGDFVFTVIAVVMIREIAPLVVGLLALGRGGLLILDELSELRRDGQCRALDVQGIDPFLTLVMPRVLALALSVFCLTMILLVVAFAAGYVMGSLLGVAGRTPVEYVARASDPSAPDRFAALRRVHRPPRRARHHRRDPPRRPLGPPRRRRDPARRRRRRQPSRRVRARSAAGP